MWLYGPAGAGKSAITQLVMPKFSSELMQEPRTERTEPSVQVQFSSVHGFWAVGSVLGSMIFKNLRTGFKPVRTELSVHIFFKFFC